MLFKLLTEDACNPTRARATDAGLDLYANETVVISPGVIKMVGTGVSVAIPDNCYGILALRSSSGKKGLCLPNGVGIIDAEYRGELKLLLTSLTTEQVVTKGDKIAQLIINPLVLAPLKQYTGTDYEWENSTSRGANGFGSTGT